MQNCVNVTIKSDSAIMCRKMWSMQSMENLKCRWIHLTFFSTKWLASFPFFSDNFFFFKYLFHTLQGSFASAFNNTCVNVLWHIGIMIIFLHYLMNRKKNQRMLLTQMECWTTLKTHQTNKLLLQSKAIIVRQYFVPFIQTTHLSMISYHKTC